MKKSAALVVLALSVALARPSEAQYVQNDVFSFQAANQNMWGGSGAAEASYEAFLGVEWNTTMNIGGIAGSENTTIIPGGCIWFFGTHCWTAVTADTRTGLLITGLTNGRIGLDVGATINAGRVDVTMPGQATLSTGSLTANAPGSTFTIGTGYTVDPTATMHTQFPSIELYADFVFDVFAGGQVEACLVFAGCMTESGTFIDWDETLELASFNRDGSGDLRVLGFDVPLAGSVGAVDFELFPPNLETDAEATSTALHSSGDVNILELSVDVPSLVADLILPGSSYALGGSMLGFSYTVLSASLGPRFGIGQAFTFTSTPMTTLSFSTPVRPIVNGVTLAPTLSFDARLGSALDFVFPDALTLDVTPTYWLDNSINVDTDFLSRLGFNLSVLELDTPLGGLGPLFERDFQTSAVPIGIDDRSFALAFNSHQGETFQLSTVPEPATWVLLGCGLLVLGALGWGRRIG
jgi:hypothetical protein